MNTLLGTMVKEGRISDTKFKLQETEYFFNQMKKTAENMTEFIFNLNAFLYAARSVTLVMQHEYKIKINGKDRLSTWYRDNVRNILGSDVDSTLFNTLRVKVVHKEGNPREELRKVVVKDLIFRYDILGSETKEDEEIKPSSKQETSSSSLLSQQPIQSTINYNPDAQDLVEKYILYLEDIKDEAKTTKKYVFPTCNHHLQRLRRLVEDCEKNLG
jgi:hypothetical protein